MKLTDVPQHIVSRGITRELCFLSKRIITATSIGWRLAREQA
ncbi:MAG: hypothetical protein WAO71_01445 [Gallionella sp.]